MNEKSNRRIYQPPQARDLSPYSAEGGGIGPLGECASGSYPFYNCKTGTAYVGTCGGGSTHDTSLCVTGQFHQYPQCNNGHNAATICLSGSHQ
jgi:hypothetical protein